MKAGNTLPESSPVDFRGVFEFFGYFISRQIAKLIVINSVRSVGLSQHRFNFLLQSCGMPPISVPRLMRVRVG